MNSCHFGMSSDLASMYESCRLPLIGPKKHANRPSSNNALELDPVSPFVPTVQQLLEIGGSTGLP
jgi:hypothetical protein